MGPSCAAATSRTTRCAVTVTVEVRDWSAARAQTSARAGPMEPRRSGGAFEASDPTRPGSAAAGSSRPAWNAAVDFHPVDGDMDRNPTRRRCRVVAAPDSSRRRRTPLSSDQLVDVVRVTGRFGVPVVIRAMVHPSTLAGASS